MFLVSVLSSFCSFCFCVSAQPYLLSDIGNVLVISPFLIDLTNQTKPLDEIGVAITSFELNKWCMYHIIRAKLRVRICNGVVGVLSCFFLDRAPMLLHDVLYIDVNGAPVRGVQRRFVHNLVNRFGCV